MASKSSVVKPKFVENRIQGYLDEIFKPRGINLKLSDEGLLTFTHHGRSFKLEVLPNISCLVISTKFYNSRQLTSEIMQAALILNQRTGPLAGACLSLDSYTNDFILHYSAHLTAINADSLEKVLVNFLRITNSIAKLFES